MDNQKPGKTLKPEKTYVYPLIICILLFILSFFLSPYSPFYRYVFAPDEVCYKTMGIGLLEGKAPYRDLFDHKGPLSYFIYAIGFLLSQKANWGAWIVTLICNCVAYIYTYKAVCVFRDKEHALLTTILTMVVTGFCLENVFSDLSKPENMLLAPLMVSTYYLLKEMHKKDEAGFKSFSNKTMFIHGLMCGAVFMIKLNVCLFYFAFIGCYFLWLLIRKNFSTFLKNTGVFLGGIAAVCAPIVLILACMKCLREFIEVYFIFNLKYSQKGDGIFYLNKVVLTVPGKISVTLIILLTILAIVRDHLQKKLDKQRVIMIVLGILVTGVLTAPLICTYFYIVFLPFILYGADCLASILMLLAKDEVSRKQIPIMVVVIFAISTVFQTFIAPYIPWQKSEHELKIEEYAVAHPQAQVLYLDRICTAIFSDYMPTIPEFRMFYVPPASNTDLVAEQKKTIADHKTDVVVFSGGFVESRDQYWRDYLESNGYSSYVVFHEIPEDESSQIFFMYVLNPA